MGRACIPVRRYVQCVLGIACLLAYTLTLAAAPLDHELMVELDPLARTLRVSGRVIVPAAADTVLRLRESLTIESLTVDGKPVPLIRADKPGPGIATWSVQAPRDRNSIVEFRYHGIVDSLDATLDHRQVLGLTSPVAGSDGAFLPSNTLWHPQADGLLNTYRVAVRTPATVRAVVPGRISDESIAAAGNEAVFESRSPLPGIDLIAGPYDVDERIVTLDSRRRVRVRTYFHRELAPLSRDYLASAEAYIARYDRAIGPYAFDTYNIVSSALPVGFGLPGVAYLGRQVLRLPFIRVTSLGHEVLHGWWGNGVYPDYARGNWSEGLTTFLADYAFKEDEGDASAQAMRLQWLRDYAAIGAGEDRALTSFVSRRHGADQALGYNKTAFVFLMLRDLLGEAPFREALARFYSEHRFRTAAWDDLRIAFEAVSGRDLSRFFSQWVARSGAPELHVIRAQRSVQDDRQRVRIEIGQRGAVYQLRVPVRIFLDNGNAIDEHLTIDAARAVADIDTPSRAMTVAIDPDARLFRRLAEQEIAPTLRRVLFDRRGTLYIASRDDGVRKPALELAEAMMEHRVRVVDRVDAVGDAPVMIIGLHGELSAALRTAALPDLTGRLPAAGTARAYAGRTAEGRYYVVIDANDAESLVLARRALPHLGAQSFAVLDGARSIARGVWPAEPIRTPVTD
jgi:hypothetical protein